MEGTGKGHAQTCILPSPVAQGFCSEAFWAVFDPEAGLWVPSLSIALGRSCLGFRGWSSHHTEAVLCRGTGPSVRRAVPAPTFHRKSIVTG